MSTHHQGSAAPQKTSGATAGALTASFMRSESLGLQRSALRASQFCAPLTGAAPPWYDLALKPKAQSIILNNFLA